MLASFLHIRRQRKVLLVAAQFTFVSISSTIGFIPPAAKIALLSSRQAYPLSCKAPNAAIFSTMKEAISDNKTDLEPSTGKRIQQTLEPCVILMNQIMSDYAALWKEKGGVYSLAQGIVYWKPPPMVSTTIIDSLNSPDSDLHLYNSASGIPVLVAALEEKVKRENHLSEVSVMVTAGANQAYMNCVLTLLDEGQKAVVFRPYYFNHVMAIQMTRGDEALLVGPSVGDSGLPDVDWLQEQLEQDQVNDPRDRINLVTVVDPCNPTGLKIPNTTMKIIVNLCKRYGVWLVVDNTYEHFDHADGSEHFPCHGDPHVINIFSLSKGYSMAGYRVGYITVSTASEPSVAMYEQMLKVQDTIPICVSRLSQLAAVGALQAGRQWVLDQVKTLDSGREAVLAAMSSLETVIGGTGAMYLMGKLPDGVDDVEFARGLVRDYGIAVIPGTFCGAPGWIRVCYSNLPPEECKRAAARLADGIMKSTSKS